MQLIRVKSVRKVGTVSSTYNLQVIKNHNFFASGVLVHNCDDAHNVREGESDAARNSVLMWWDEVMASRLNNPKTGVKVVIMQRVHEADLSGHILETDANHEWSHLCLPARFEGEHNSHTALNFKDPRTTEGEPLWPEQYGDKQLKELEQSMSAYAAAGQLQQRPAPRTGGMFSKFIEADVVPAAWKRLRTVRAWDKAGTTDGGAYTAGVLMSRYEAGLDTMGRPAFKYVVHDVIRGQWSAGKRETIIRQTAQQDGKEVIIYVEQEPGSGGKESAEGTVRGLVGYTVRIDRVTGSKEIRAEPYATQVEWENVVVIKNPNWTRAFLEEHRSFPKGKFKDQVDGASMAFSALSRAYAKAGGWSSR